MTRREARPRRPDAFSTACDCVVFYSCSFSVDSAAAAQQRVPGSLLGAESDFLIRHCCVCRWERAGKRMVTRISHTLSLLTHSLYGVRTSRQQQRCRVAGEKRYSLR